MHEVAIVHMQGNPTNDIYNFYVAGINYKKTDAEIRGHFAVNNDQYAALLGVAPSYGIKETFVLSTCNRTEIYGFAEDASQLMHLLCSHTAGSFDTFHRLAYVKKGIQAIEHLFNVGAGLDSQILGDYEIVGQIKQAVHFARQHKYTGSISERLVNAVLQSSKVIKNQTALSGGTVSVSFAAVQYIRQTVDIAHKKILLLGVGKIGRSTCKNLVDYLGTKNITLINRTVEKAAALAGELGLHYVPETETASCIQSADIIIVATNAPTPAIMRAGLEHSGTKVIIDLSVPYNVDTAVRELPHISLVNVDELSKMKDETIKKREADIPKAKAIIAAHIAEFLEWNELRRYAPVLKAVKSKLQEITSGEQLLPLTSSTTNNSDEKIQMVINVMALKMRRHNQRGCHYIEAINDFMATASN